MTFAVSAVVLLFLGAWKAIELAVSALERWDDRRHERRRINRYRRLELPPMAIVRRGRR